MAQSGTVPDTTDTRLAGGNRALGNTRVSQGVGGVPGYGGGKVGKDGEGEGRRETREGEGKGEANEKVRERMRKEVW